ncbi:MAG TPA: alpha/beta hydrolase [Candidatus Limnocylindria bacterium]|nr:alpha/beta hydrolase [Candidatus Limnocylindria bacterium]
MVQLAVHQWPAVADAGAPPPLALLVHGIAGWWQTWWRVGPALAGRGWRVVAVDLRGHGASSRIEAPVTREQLAFDLAETIEALEVLRFDVAIGHSLGAAAVQELAHGWPELVGRIVLEDPPGQDRTDDLSYQTHLADEVRAAMETPEAEIERTMRENPSWLREDAEQNVEGQRLCDINGILASLRAGMGSRVPELAPILTMPALYLLATEDRSAIRGEARRDLIAGVPAGSTVLEIESGHTIHRDRFDEYIRVVTGWLAETERT